MPYRKKYRKRRRYRKKYRKRKRNKMSILKVPGLLIPDTTYVKLKYQGSFNLIPLGNSVVQTFSGSGMFNPALSASAAQPRGFAQWQSFYNFNQVLGSTCKIEVTNLVNNEARILLLPKNTVTAAGFTVSAENPYAIQKVCNRPSGNRSTIQMKKHMRSKKIIGRTVSSVNYTGSGLANPLEDWFWQFHAVGIEVPNPPATDLEMSMIVTIIYHAKFFDRVNLV